MEIMAKKGFYDGFVNIFSLFPKAYKLKEESDGALEDYNALKGDWESVGADIKRGLEHRV